MKIIVLSFLVGLATIPSLGQAQESVDQMLKDFAPLISTVRGAVRHQLEQGKGCLPWASLAVDPNDRKAYVNFGFTPEMAKDLGDEPEKSIASRLNLVAKKGPFTVSAIGTCELNSSDQGDKIPNVVALLLERRNGLALKLHFPFQQSINGQVNYIAGKSTIEKTAPLVFRQPNP